MMPSSRSFPAILFLLSFNAFPLLQAQVATKAEQDTRARASLDMMRKRYEGFTTLEIPLRMDTEIPGQGVEVRKGLFQRKGIRYRLVMDSQTVFSDGKALYVVLPEDKEVQIDALPLGSEGEDELSPEALFRIYRRKDLSYYLLEEFSEKGRMLQRIGFKPTDRNAEYTKMEMVLDRKTGEVLTFKVFSRDGSRYTVTFGATRANQPLPDGLFQWRKSDYPGYHVEDLRS